MLGDKPRNEPAMMVALRLYAYYLGERSSRQIEQLCERDIAFRVIAATYTPIIRRSHCSGRPMRQR